MVVGKIKLLTAGPKIFNVKIVPLSLGITLIGGGFAMLYYLMKDDDECDSCEDLEVQQNKRRRTFCEVRIEKDKVGYLIGKSGITIREIQEKTATRITFKDENASENYRECIIRGLPANVQKAEYMVKDFLEKHKIEIAEFLVPNSACGLIIGKGGTTIRALQKNSGAKITVDSSEFGVKGQKVTLKGTAKEVAEAKRLIEEKIKEDCPDKGFSQFQSLTPTDVFESYESSNVETMPPEEDFINVHLSALTSPSCFYIQIADERLKLLEALEKDIFEFYENEENRNFHKLETAGVGRTVACQFKDGKWYRGTVVKTKSNNERVKVFYVDYGDVEWKKISSVFALNPKFQELKHQAIKCSLEGIEQLEEKWSEEAVDMFENLTYDSENKKVMLAKVKGFCESPFHSYIPSVILKTSGDGDGLLVSEELIALGYGRPVASIIPNLLPGGEEDWN
ncbi:tudor and KH domain-containing protein homolog [Neocloeon triangulifer]|uniref:tudor and KH domain-containing protein homolog n=1 Tax=Neocloeon triangulifer TaxID=2078957 RepID=UPI00286F39AA|nr:tudor and KH domain-containing protein homolog [Neocloeon triangulifer]XP_059469873.1 tudor and KH domain-containing protein homolog [Neocloeon triangulifer]XP_059469874.1 tudor and KH domain-containing protein homolog [Neocloeon triangulifer]